jgi:hypothetical protein
MQLSSDGLVLIRVLDNDINDDGKFRIPDSVTHIGGCAFCGCSGLTQITIPNSVTQIGNGAFCGCSGLTQITIPNSVTRIGNWAFSECSSLTQITLSDSVTQIGRSAFMHCSSLTQITIPDSVTQIDPWAFMHCSSLTQITIPDSVTQIGDEAFRDCTSLTQITIPDSVTQIGDEAFRDCTSLTQITIPESVRYISDDAFRNCPSLEAIVINDSVQQAFERISRLIPEKSQPFIIPYTLWCEISKAKEQALGSTQPIGMSSFPLKTQEVVVNLIQQMEGSLHDVINQVHLPYRPEQLEQYKQHLQQALNLFKEEQDAMHQRPAREAAIHKLCQLIKVNQETIQCLENKNPGFFNQNKYLSNLAETHVRIALADKLISWLNGDETISFDEGERAFLTKTGHSFALILQNCGIGVEQLPKPPTMGL